MVIILIMNTPDMVITQSMGMAIVDTLDKGMVILTITILGVTSSGSNAIVNLYDCVD